MTRGADIPAVRRATSPARDELRRRLLALVLAAVLAWYTVVVPSGAYVRNSAPRPPDDGGRDGEVRGRGAEADSRAYSAAGAKGGFAFGADAVGDERESVEDLEWPEYIYPD